jgi:4-amino-4-deoxy-L-arabinose transferase-like glycosyltransferase
MIQPVRDMLGRPAAVLAAAMVVGMLARLWVVHHASMPAYAVDQLFDTLAANVWRYHAFSLDGIQPAAHVGPLYPALLALWYGAVGHRPESVWILHMGLDLAAGWCVYRVGHLLFGSWVAAVAASCFFLYPAYWTYVPRIRSEVLLTMLVCAWLWATLRCVRSPSISASVGMGLMAGLALLCKPAVWAVVLGAGACVWAAEECRRKKMTCILTYGACCALAVLPWTVRNYVAFNDLIPVSAGLGAGLWMGSDPASRGSWPMPFEREQAIWDSAGISPLPHAYAMYEVPVDRILRHHGRERIQADPLAYLRLTLGRTWDFWIGNSFYLFNGEAGLAEGWRRDAQERGRVVALYSFAKRMFLVPALIAASVASTWFFRSMGRQLLPLWIFPLGLMAGYVPFTVEAARYTLPVLPCLMVLTAALSVRLMGVYRTQPRGFVPREIGASWRTS